MPRSSPTVLVTAAYLPAPWNPERWFVAAVPAAYLDAVRLAGGVPLVAGPFDDRAAARAALRRADAVLLVGGPDLDPAGYGQRRHPRTDVMHPRRERSDLRLARMCAEAGKPLLGVCGGMQAINVALGGTLHQHVPELPGAAGAEPHGTRVPDDNLHRVRLVRGSRLWRMLKRVGELEVNSSHHQAVDRLAEGLVAAAWSPGALLEALEGERRDAFLLGVQWHPERLAVAPPAGDAGAAPAKGRPEHLAVFRALVNAAR